jgi:hypothetical protein
MMHEEYLKASWPPSCRSTGITAYCGDWGTSKKTAAPASLLERIDRDQSLAAYHQSLTNFPDAMPISRYA